MDKIMLRHWRLPVLDIKAIENNDSFVSFKVFNLEWITTLNCLLPSIGVNQGTGSVKIRSKFLEKKLFFHFPSLQSSPSPHLDSHLCDVAPMRKDVLEKRESNNSSRL